MRHHVSASQSGDGNRQQLASVVYDDRMEQKTRSDHHNLGLQDTQPQVQPPSTTSNRGANGSSTFDRAFCNNLPPIAMPLPKVLANDAKIERPDQHFCFAKRYQYERLLGHGAYGMVCAARDLHSGSAIAIKRINQINSILVARRTLRELKLLRHFQGHPNIISIKDLFLPCTPEVFNVPEQIVDFNSFDGLFISQELMDADLCHLIQSKYHFSDEHVQYFMFQMLRGLAALHAGNVLHRDLKPGNILWKHNGELRICDFGLARGIAEEERDMQDGSTRDPVTAMTNYVATRWYRPPEILMYRANYGRSLDIWSVGCIFAELLGRRVFLPGQSGFEQLHLILRKLGTPSDEVIERIPSQKSIAYLKRLPVYPAHSLAKRFPQAPALAIDLLHRMLMFDPNERISAMDALAHPYFARFHYLLREIRQEQIAPFDCSFDRECVTLSQIKSAILDEVALYRPLLIPSLRRLSVSDHHDGSSTNDRKKKVFPFSFPSWNSRPNAVLAPIRSQVNAAPFGQPSIPPPPSTQSNHQQQQEQQQKGTNGDEQLQSLAPLMDVFRRRQSSSQQGPFMNLPRSN